MENKFVHILAARPNFIKSAPVIKALDNKGCNNIIIHTNQHYDFMMSQVFFQDLKIPEPDYHLGIGSGTHAIQTGESLIEIEKILIKESPKAVLVYGDVNSSLAGALAAAKLNIPVYHIEAGCRSGDKTMAEEINRILIDNCSNLLFCIEPRSVSLLQNEGINNSNLVGNTAIDSLHIVKKNINKKNLITNKEFYLATLHRPFNVDNQHTLNQILHQLNKFDKPIIFPAHPRLEKNLTKKYLNIKFIDPLGYIDFITHINYSSGVISDSGGIQCETCFLKKPLLTLRPSTEHTTTLEYGNKLVPNIKDLSSKLFKTILNKKTPMIWDGKASERIVDIILK
jgi:UDP-N-acetylglucosamine 2-epimerase